MDGDRFYVIIMYIYISMNLYGKWKCNYSILFISSIISLHNHWRIDQSFIGFISEVDDSCKFIIIIYLLFFSIIKIQWIIIYIKNIDAKLSLSYRSNVTIRFNDNCVAMQWKRFIFVCSKWMLLE